jgi:hypothetical protein
VPGIEEDVLAGEVGEIGVVLFDELGEGGVTSSRSAWSGHDLKPRSEPRVGVVPGGG